MLLFSLKISGNAFESCARIIPDTHLSVLVSVVHCNHRCYGLWYCYDIGHSTHFGLVNAFTVVLSECLWFCRHFTHCSPSFYPLSHFSPPASRQSLPYLPSIPAREPLLARRICVTLHQSALSSHNPATSWHTTASVTRHLAIIPDICPRPAQTADPIQNPSSVAFRKVICLGRNRRDKETNAFVT